MKEVDNLKGRVFSKKEWRPAPDPDEVYSLKQAIYMLGTSYPTLMKYVELGEVEAKKVGPHWLFIGSDLLKAFDVRKRYKGAMINGD